MRVLLVEDDRALLDLTAIGLRRERYAVDTADDGQAALDHLAINDYDLVVLDRDLLVVHGDDVLRAIVERPPPRPRVLLLTAFGSLADRVEGLNLGADDYLPKPFAMTELAARLAALSRRPDLALDPVMTVGDLRLEMTTLTARRGERLLELTPKEFGVLAMLMRHAPRPVSSEELLEHVWDANADPFSRAVVVTIANLRKKLGSPALIHTRIGVGYSIAC